jgi:aminodeoxyfutalosine deaminase
MLLHAHSVLPVADEPIPDGAVAVENHRIIALGPWGLLRKHYPKTRVVDLTDCVLLPGLINAHTHFELSHLKDRIAPGGNFVAWIRKLVAARRRATEPLADVIRAACRESIPAGTTTVGDISHQHQAWPILNESPIRKVCFAEVLDITPQWPKAAFYLERCLADTPADKPLLRLGFSPHAPYSVTPELYTLTTRKAARHRLPLATHLAESADEIEFLQTGIGPWRAYIEQIGKWDDSFVCPHTTPVDYFLKLDLADQPFLLAHVNYITDDELRKLAKTGHSVAWCPRAHAFFRHPPHRFRDMLAAGVNVCLGTDSLACNSTLSILDEMRFLHRNCPDVPSATILRMATLNAAKALRWDDRIGSIEPEKFADLIAVPLADPISTDPCFGLLESNCHPRFVMIHGEILVG